MGVWQVSAEDDVASVKRAPLRLGVPNSWVLLGPTCMGEIGSSHRMLLSVGFTAAGACAEVVAANLKGPAPKEHVLVDEVTDAGVSDAVGEGGSWAGLSWMPARATEMRWPWSAEKTAAVSGASARVRLDACRLLGTEDGLLPLLAWVDFSGHRGLGRALPELNLGEPTGGTPHRGDAPVLLDVCALVKFDPRAAATAPRGIRGTTSARGRVEW